MVRQAGGFDERLTSAAMEDLELGWRLQRGGNRLIYSPELVVAHDHPTSYADSLRRMRRVGAAAAQVASIHPDSPEFDLDRGARRKWPGLRVANSLLRGAHELPGLRPPLREARWAIAHREAFYRGYCEVRHQN
jgi:Glycosyl transferase family group 2